MHMIRVFPSQAIRGGTSPRIAHAEATEKSMDEDLAEVQVDNARAMGCHVDHYSMLGLCEFQHAPCCSPILQAGLNGKKLLSDGSFHQKYCSFEPLSPWKSCREFGVEVSRH